MNRPLRLTECFVGVFGVFAPHFVGVSCVFRWCSQRFGNPFAA
ncbi:hypothetical protein [Prevotella pallens]|nr:hypothetical protein [Prevotella pallens]